MDYKIQNLGRRADWDQEKQFSQTIAQTLAQQYPDRFVAEMSKAARQGKIFIDYLRNDRGSTAIAPYSTLAKGQASVAMPIGWKELSPKLSPDCWAIHNAAQRLQSLKQDPWRDFWQTKQTLPKLKASLPRLLARGATSP